MNMSMVVGLITCFLALVCIMMSSEKSDALPAVGWILCVIGLVFVSMGISDMNLDDEIEKCEQAGGTPVVRVGQVYSTLERCDP